VYAGELVCRHGLLESGCGDIVLVVQSYAAAVAGEQRTGTGALRQQQRWLLTTCPAAGPTSRCAARRNANFDVQGCCPLRKVCCSDRLTFVHQLWQENRDGSIAAAAAVIADNLPGGWTDKQVCCKIFEYSCCIRFVLVLCAGRGMWTDTGSGCGVSQWFVVLAPAVEGEQGRWHCCCSSHCSHWRLDRQAGVLQQAVFVAVCHVWVACRHMGASVRVSIWWRLQAAVTRPDIQPAT
jgi:hypothetical protein